MTTIEFNDKLVGLRQTMKYFALSLTRDAEEAADLTQETCLKALLYKDHFKTNDNFKAWLLTIMKNTFINAYNRNSRHKMVMDKKDIQSIIVSNKIDENTSPEVIMGYAEIKKQISLLKDDYKTAFQMHLDGYKYKEIADELNIPLGTVKSRIFLAKKDLMVVLKDSRN